MPKLFLRFIALLLVPCLLAAPVTASAFTSAPAIRIAITYSTNFNEQALELPVLLENHVERLLNNHPRIASWLRRAASHLSVAPNPLFFGFDSMLRFGLARNLIQDDKPQSAVALKVLFEKRIPTEELNETLGRSPYWAGFIASPFSARLFQSLLLVDKKVNGSRSANDVASGVLQAMVLMMKKSLESRWKNDLAQARGVFRAVRRGDDLWIELDYNGWLEPPHEILNRLFVHFVSLPKEPVLHADLKHELNLLGWRLEAGQRPDTRDVFVAIVVKDALRKRSGVPDRDKILEALAGGKRFFLPSVLGELARYPEESILDVLYAAKTFVSALLSHPEVGPGLYRRLIADRHPEHRALRKEAAYWRLVHDETAAQDPLVLLEDADFMDFIVTDRDMFIQLSNKLGNASIMLPPEVKRRWNRKLNQVAWNILRQTKTIEHEEAMVFSWVLTEGETPRVICATAMNEFGPEKQALRLIAARWQMENERKSYRTMRKWVDDSRRLDVLLAEPELLLAWENQLVFLDSEVQRSLQRSIVLFLWRKIRDSKTAIDSTSKAFQWVLDHSVDALTLCDTAISKFSPEKEALRLTAARWRLSHDKKSVENMQKWLDDPKYLECLLSEQEFLSTWVGRLDTINQESAHLLRQRVMACLWARLINLKVDSRLPHHDGLLEWLVKTFNPKPTVSSNNQQLAENLLFLTLMAYCEIDFRPQSLASLSLLAVVAGFEKTLTFEEMMSHWKDTKATVQSWHTILSFIEQRHPRDEWPTLGAEFHQLLPKGKTLSGIEKQKRLSEQAAAIGKEHAIRPWTTDEGHLLDLRVLPGSWPIFVRLVHALREQGLLVEQNPDMPYHLLYSACIEGDWITRAPWFLLASFGLDWPSWTFFAHMLWRVDKSETGSHRLRPGQAYTYTGATVNPVTGKQENQQVNLLDGAIRREMPIFDEHGRSLGVLATEPYGSDLMRKALLAAAWAQRPDLANEFLAGLESWLTRTLGLEPDQVALFKNLTIQSGGGGSDTTNPDLGEWFSRLQGSMLRQAAREALSDPETASSDPALLEFAYSDANATVDLAAAAYALDTWRIEKAMVQATGRRNQIFSNLSDDERARVIDILKTMALSPSEGELEALWERFAERAFDVLYPSVIVRNVVKLMADIKIPTSELLERMVWELRFLKNDAAVPAKEQEVAESLFKQLETASAAASEKRNKGTLGALVLFGFGGLLKGLQHLGLDPVWLGGLAGLGFIALTGWLLYGLAKEAVGFIRTYHNKHYLVQAA